LVVAGRRIGDAKRVYAARRRHVIDPSSPYYPDPSIVNYVQGGGAVPQGPPPQAMPSDPYGLPPGVTSAMQGGFAPQQIGPAFGGGPPGGQIPDEVAQGAQVGFAPPQESPSQPIGMQPQIVPAENTNGDVPVFHLPPATPTSQQATPSPAAAKARTGQENAQAAYAASPEGMQDTAANAEIANLQQRGVVAGKLGDVQAQQSDAAKKIYDQAAIDSRAEYVATQKKAAQDAADRQVYFDDYVKAQKEQAAKTIDPNRMWNSKSTGEQLLAAIGVMLAGIGQGMDHDKGPNPAVAIIQQAIDRDIDAQKANLQQGEKGVEGKYQALTGFEHLTDKSNEALEALRATRYRQVGEQVAASAAQFAGPQQKLVAQDAQLKLNQLADGITDNLAGAKIAQRNKDQEIAIQRANVGVAAGHLALAQKGQGLDEKYRRDMMAQHDKEFGEGLAEKIVTARGAGNAAQAKQLGNVLKYGVLDPATGKTLLTPDGDAVMAHADQLEKAARSAPDIATRDALVVQAKGLRDAAETQYAALSDNAKTIKPKLAAAQNLVDGVSGVLEEFDKDPSSFDRAKWAQLETMIERAKTADAQFMGAKVSSREMQAIQPAFGADVDSVTNRVASRGKIRAALTAIMGGIESDTDSMLRSEGVLKPGSKYHLAPQRGEVEPTLGEPTAIEAGQAEEPSWLRRHAGMTEDIANNVGPQLHAEDNAPQGPTGLGLHATEAVSSLVNRYHDASDEERAKIATQLSQYALSPRESFANGALGLIRNDPEVYGLILQALPPEKRAQMEKFDAVQSPAWMTRMVSPDRRSNRPASRAPAPWTAPAPRPTASVPSSGGGEGEGP
jgi:hypothetical protein